MIVKADISSRLGQLGSVFFCFGQCCICDVLKIVLLFVPSKGKYMLGWEGQGVVTVSRLRVVAPRYPTFRGALSVHIGIVGPWVHSISCGPGPETRSDVM